MPSYAPKRVESSDRVSRAVDTLTPTSASLLVRLSEGGTRGEGDDLSAKALRSRFLLAGWVVTNLGREAAKRIRSKSKSFEPESAHE